MSFEFIILVLWIKKGFLMLPVQHFSAVQTKFSGLRSITFTPTCRLTDEQLESFNRNIGNEICRDLKIQDFAFIPPTTKTMKGFVFWDDDESQDLTDIQKYQRNPARHTALFRRLLTQATLPENTIIVRPSRIKGVLNIWLKKGKQKLGQINLV